MTISMLISTFHGNQKQRCQDFMIHKGLGSRNQTSPWVLGIIVALAIFFSTKSRAPVLSSEALTKVPEL